MTTLLVILWAILAVVLTLVLAIRPKRTKHSRFELKRRGDDAALRRESLLDDIAGVQRFVSQALVVLLTALGFISWQWLGVLYVVVVIVLAGFIARLQLVRRTAMRLYDRYEPRLLNGVERAPVIGRVLGDNHVTVRDMKIESDDELRHVIESAGNVLDHEQQKLLLRGMDWHATAVQDVMTPRGDIDSVPAGELLGPLVLHDLHQTGHTVFPVVKKDLDHVVGVLDIAELLRIDKSTHSHRAEQVMQQEVYTVVHDAPLPVALQLFLSTRTSLLIVTGNTDKTVGIVTLRDVVGALLGKSI